MRDVNNKTEAGLAMGSLPMACGHPGPVIQLPVNRQLWEELVNAIAFVQAHTEAQVPELEILEVGIGHALRIAAREAKAVQQ